MGGDSDIESTIQWSAPFAGHLTSAAYNMCINNGDLLIAALVKRSDAIQGIQTRALGKVYRLDITGTTELEYLNRVNINSSGDLKAFDLKIGISNTNDGGYVVTSTLHNADLYTGLAEDLEYYPETICDYEYEVTSVWNGDPYVAKFDDSDVMEWSNTYPSTDASYDYGVQFPDDIKRLECVYEVFQTPDGGYVIGGNNSLNFDDDLIFKLYSECNRNTGYPSEVDQVDPADITGDVTWDSDRKVIGIVTIKAGGSLTITNEVVIQFADSKSADHPTYIIVERGGLLFIEDGAVLTGIIECNTMWDGIFVYGTNGTNQPTEATLISDSYFDDNNNHGVVRIISEGTIQNARYGIFAGKMVANIVNTSYGGGIVIADNANFINNTYDIYFTTFNKTNRSLLRNCNFSTTEILLDEEETLQAHVF